MALGTDENRYTATLNLFYDVPLGETVVPYVGGGLGGAHVEDISGTGVDNFGRTAHFVGGDVTRGVALLEGGLTVTVTPNIAVVPAYRWIRFFGGAGLGQTESAHIAKLGLRYSF
jgi:opacity protein-like surface antigen